MHSLNNLDDLKEGTHVVKFYATWCGPCKLYAPIFANAEDRYPNVTFHEFDVDSDLLIREEFGVISVPTTIVVKDGQEISRASGLLTVRMLDTLLSAC